MCKNIGIIVNDLDYPFNTILVSGAMEYLGGKGYSLLIMDSNSKLNPGKILAHVFTMRDIEGLIIAPGILDIEYLSNLKLNNFPFVLLEDVKGIRANIVTIDNARAIKIAITYLTGIGHSKIIHFAGPPLSPFSLERIEGFKNAIGESNIAFYDRMIVPVGAQFAESFANTIKYFKNKKPDDYPTAIVCLNDYQATAVISAMEKLNIKVPDDISVVGIDCLLDDRFYPIPLTTIKTPLREMGIKASEILLKNIETPHVLPDQRIILDTEFIIRDSTIKNKAKESYKLNPLNAVNF